jgi:peptide/nickel transport system substrate-binding protein
VARESGDRSLPRLSRRQTALGGTTLAVGAALAACAPGRPAQESAPAAPGAATAPSGTPAPIATAAGGVPTTGGVVPTPRDQTVVIDQGVFQVFDSFNPYIPNGQQYQAGYIQAAKEYLFYANFAAGKVEPHLGTGWKYNEDFTQLTLSLNPKATWSDGKPFTASDVKFTLEMLIKNPSLLLGADVRRFVDTVATPDPQTVQIKLKAANPRFHYVFICGIVSGFEVVPEHIWGSVDPTTFKDNPPVRTGPYVLDRVIPEQFMFIWKKNPNYWNRANEDFKPQYVVYRSSPVVDSAIEEFKRGQSDMVNHGIVTFTHMKAIQDSGYKTMQIETRFRDPCPRGFSFNSDASKGILADPRGRWAISSLIDREKIGNNVWLMKTPPAQYPWADYKSNSQWENTSLAGQYKLAYDPRKAAAMLDDLGAKAGADGKRVFNGKPVQIEIGTQALVGQPEHAIAELVAGELTKLGVDATFRAYTGTVWTTKFQTGDFDIWSGWICGADFDPDRLFTNYQGDRAMPIGQTASSGNEVRLQAPPFDAVTKQLDVSDPSDSKNKPLFDQALEEYYKALPSTPIIQTTYPVCTNTSYWTGWPTDDDLYQVPLGWWGQFHFVLARLKPTGKK